MAYFINIPATKTSFNGGSALTVDTIFTCERGMIGISTDDAPLTVTDATDSTTRSITSQEQRYRALEEGVSIVIKAGNIVVYQSLGAYGPAEMHTMPA